MANKHRGEVSIKIGGKTYTMRTTFEGLCQIENEIGLSVMELARKCLEKRLGILEMSVIASSSIENGPSDAEIGEQLITDGIASFMEPIAEFFIIALEGGGQAKNVKASAGK